MNENFIIEKEYKDKDFYQRNADYLRRLDSLNRTGLIGLADKLNKQRYDTLDDQGQVLQRPLTAADPLALIGVEQETIKDINKSVGDIPEPIADAIINFLDYLESRKEPKDMAEGRVVETNFKSLPSGRPEKAFNQAYDAIQYLRDKEEISRELMNEVARRENPILEMAKSMDMDAAIQFLREQEELDKIREPSYLQREYDRLVKGARAGPIMIDPDEMPRTRQKALEPIKIYAEGGMVGTNQPMQMKGIADVLANQGRYGDTMLVHMNPAEVQGLASLSPTGSLTVNPQTGQPEAFLGMILGALGGLAGSSGALAAVPLIGKLGAAGLGALGSGLGTFIETGDLKKGLLGGITGYGLGKVMGGIAGSGAGDVAKDALVDEASKSITVTPAIASTPSQSLLELAKKQGIDVTDGIMSELPGAGSFSEAANRIGIEAGDVASNIVQNPSVLMDAASTGAIVPAAVGLGGRAAIEAQEAMERQFGADAARQKAIGERQDQIIAQSGFNPFLQPARVPVSNYDIDTATYTASAGGIVSIDPNDFRRRREELMRMGMPVKKMFPGGNIDFGDIINPIGGPGGLGPANRQAALRGSITLTPEELDAKIAEQGMPGFGPEINYFREPTPEEIEAGKPPITTPGFPSDGSFQMNPQLQQAVNDLIAGRITLEEYQQMVSGFTTPAIDPASQNVTATTAGANAARDYSEYAEGGEVMPEGGIDPDRLITLAEMAVRGELPEAEAEVVIKMFMDQFGAEAFSQLRESVLEAIVPNSQKEGEIVGQGGGMDDLVQGMIGTQQPVAVSPGEYIVPADVVSGLGDGSTDAGVQQLDGMLDRVRMERTGTTQQPAPLAKGGMLPR